MFIGASLEDLTPEQIEKLVESGCPEFTMDNEPVKGPHNTATFKCVEDVYKAMDILGLKYQKA